MAKKYTTAQLAERCAKDLQLLVRLKAANDSGYATCVTCGKVDHWKAMQGGHYMERGRSATKLLEENIHVQCPGCNCFKMKVASGVVLYREYMVSMYGEDAVKEIEQLSRKPHKWVKSDILELHEQIKDQIKIHKARVGDG